MSAAGNLVQEAFRIEERGIDWRAACAGALAAIGPLAVGLALGETVAGLTAAIAGLNTALCTPQAGLRTRVWWTTLAALGGAASLALADLVGGHTWSLVAMTLVWCGGLAFLRAAGRPGALVGFATGAVFTILAGIPTDPAPVLQQLLWFALGAAPAAAIMVWARRGSGDPGHLARATMRAVRDGVLHDAGLQAHALRLGVAVALGTLIYRVIDLPHGYWVALTTLAILQPGEHATRVRAVQRAAGTLAGAALIVLVTLITDDRWALVACAAAAAFWLYALDERGYFWLVVMLTPTALLMLAVVDFQGDDLVLERVGNSTLGIVIGLVLGEAVWRLSSHLPAARPGGPGGD
jgi:hypothetical protein